MIKQLYFWADIQKNLYKRYLPDSRSTKKKIQLQAQGTELIIQELLCSRVLLKYKKGQRKLLTQTSEAGQRMPPSLV